jgi:hypothetical protein
LRALAELGRRIAGGELDLDDAVAMTPWPAYPADDVRRPLKRAAAHARSELTGLAPV